VAIHAQTSARPPAVSDVTLTFDGRSASKASIERRLVERVRGEFTEMRGFSPTLPQAARLFNLSREECHRIFAQLQREGFLAYCPDGRYRLT
jgi:AraC-like DNA-binding protein